MSTKERQAFLRSGELLSIAEAARLSPYSPEYLSWCARKAKLPALKIGRNWCTTSSAVTGFMNKQKQRHQTMLRKLSTPRKGSA